MSWQKCPICNGSGNAGMGWGYREQLESCKTCLGHGIINEKTGKPPGEAKKSLEQRMAKEELEKRVVLGDRR